MDFIENYPQGYWESGHKKFINKYDALLHATRTKSNIRWNYFNDTWANFDRSQLGKFTLDELYKQRALQLRESYDYLILYFSGGADSFNVLRSFIDNGIKIDEVCVKWCNATLESNSKVYTPNISDPTAYNYLSEWDYAIKPVLEWLAATHPEIKIEIVDWFKDRKLIGTEEVFRLVNHWHDVEVPSLASWSPSEEKLISQGKRVASIYGIDKPMVYFDDDKSYMFFGDGAVTMGTPNPINIYGTEYFYWSPKFPLLTFEMARHAIIEIQKNRYLSENSYRKETRGDVEHFNRSHIIQQKELRHILYSTWTDRFQATKPLELDRKDKHHWIYNYKELAQFKDSYRDMINLHTGQLRDDLYLNINGATMYKFIVSKKYLIMETKQ